MVHGNQEFSRIPAGKGTEDRLLRDDIAGLPVVDIHVQERIGVIRNGDELIPVEIVKDGRRGAGALLILPGLRPHPAVVDRSPGVLRAPPGPT